MLPRVETERLELMTRGNDSIIVECTIHLTGEVKEGMVIEAVIML